MLEDACFLRKLAYLFIYLSIHGLTRNYGGSKRNLGSKITLNRPYF